MRLRVDEITWREIDGDLVVLDLSSSTYFTANASGSLLMKQLAEEQTPDQLIEALVAAFDIPEQLAQQDVERFVDELDRRGMLERPAHSAAQARSPRPAAGSRLARRR